MSANIPIGKLSFTVFGSGYNSDRADSGAGVKEGIPLNFYARYAEFDATGQYCWIINGGLHKYETENWTRVEQGDVPSNFSILNSPKNNEYGYGIAFPPSSGTAYLFDLTTNEIINTGSRPDLWGSQYDCIDVGDGIYRFCIQSNNRAQLYLYSFDTEDFSLSLSPVTYPRAGVGFIDDNSAYVYYAPEWFYQAAYVASYNISGGEDWGQQAADDDKLFSNISMHGFTDANGHIYVPTLVNGRWKIGEYDGTSRVNFITPNYIRAFGDLGNNKPTIGQDNMFPVYSRDRSIVAFAVQDTGMYVSDFSDVYMLMNFENYKYVPIAVSDNKVLCQKRPLGSGSITLEVFEF